MITDVKERGWADYQTQTKDHELFHGTSNDARLYREGWHNARRQAESAGKPANPVPEPAKSPKVPDPEPAATPPEAGIPTPQADLTLQGPTAAEPIPEAVPEPQPAPAPTETTGQGTLFDMPPDWAAKWGGMPTFEQRDLKPWQSTVVHFATVADRQAFAELVKQTITDDTKSLWFPKAEIGRYVDKQYSAAKPVIPRYPVYVISKGRWESRLTVKALEKIGVPYRIVVELQERDRYAEVIDPAKILVLPFSNLGQGSIPARNWVWEHAIAEGHERHWILDDNIQGFYRFNQNLKVPCASGSMFRAAEDFSDRYTNVMISGFNYFMFAKRKHVIPPFIVNTRIYSCILIANSLPFRWRGRYNEDTDLSIRALKEGYCTVLFNAFLAWKMTTMTMSGGNTESLYKIKEGEKDGRLLMAESLRDQHPDIVTITEKWGRWQHSVNYRVFKNNRLVLRPDADIPKSADDYGMELEMLPDKKP